MLRNECKKTGFSKFAIIFTYVVVSYYDTRIIIMCWTLLGVMCASGGRIEWPAINVTDSQTSVTLDYIINAICSDLDPQPEFIYLTVDSGVVQVGAYGTGQTRLITSYRKLCTAKVVKDLANTTICRKLLTVCESRTFGDWDVGC